MGEGREKREMINGECKMEKFVRPDSPDNKTYSKAETYIIIISERKRVAMGNVKNILGTKLNDMYLLFKRMIGY